jgi:hypothetical protein
VALRHRSSLRRSTSDFKAIFQVMGRIDQLNLNGRKEHIEQEKLP